MTRDVMSSQEISIPDGPERRRVLNVLAQRRYRQRKRERLHFLEKRLRASTTTTTAFTFEGETQLQHPMQPPLAGSSNPATISGPPYDLYQGFKAGSADALCMYPAPYEAVYIRPESASQHERNPFETSPGLPYGNTTQSVVSASDSQLSTELQELETSQFTFLSEQVIEVPGLKSMEVSLRIAQMLGLGDDLFDITVSRVLDVSRITVPLENLPENIRPTTAQLLLPHYPVIDIIPWPSLRTKLIYLFNQPDQLRPPIARGPMAIMRLMHGFEDETEGIRVDVDVDEHGFDVKSWEVGQAVIKDWWWALTPEIISNSDRLRHRRGAPKLQL